LWIGCVQVRLGRTHARRHSFDAGWRPTGFRQRPTAVTAPTTATLEQCCATPHARRHNSSDECDNTSERNRVYGIFLLSVASSKLYCVGYTSLSLPSLSPTHTTVTTTMPRARQQRWAGMAGKRPATAAGAQPAPAAAAVASVVAVPSKSLPRRLAAAACRPVLAISGALKRCVVVDCRYNYAINTML